MHTGYTSIYWPVILYKFTQSVTGTGTTCITHCTVYQCIATTFGYIILFSHQDSSHVYNISVKTRVTVYIRILIVIIRGCIDITSIIPVDNFILIDLFLSRLISSLSASIRFRYIILYPASIFTIQQCQNWFVVIECIISKHFFQTLINFISWVRHKFCFTILFIKRISTHINDLHKFFGSL